MLPTSSRCAISRAFSGHLKTCLAGLILGSIASLAPASWGASDITAVYARTFNGYSRTKLSDATFKPETYAFAEGGRWDGMVKNASIDDMSFLKVAQIIAAPLEKQGYHGSSDGKKTDLLIFVYWGTTQGAEHGEYSNMQANALHALDSYNQANQQLAVTNNFTQLSQSEMQSGNTNQAGQIAVALKGAATDQLDGAMNMVQVENAARDENNIRNATLLGFREELARANELSSFSFSHDVVEELEANRYFVILQAYDFQTLWKHKKKKLLWETRFSIRERGNAFNKELARMAGTAAQYFGENTGRLVRKPIPEGKVEIGTPTVVESPAK